MGTMVEFKRIVRDHARLEPAAEIAVGTTTFSGDGERLFLQHNGVGLLLSDDDEVGRLLCNCWGQGLASKTFSILGGLSFAVFSLSFFVVAVFGTRFNSWLQLGLSLLGFFMTSSLVSKLL